jgi:hypothetical protein
LYTGGFSFFAAGFGVGWGLGLGTATATTVPVVGNETTTRSATSFGVLWECIRSTDDVPAATATKRIKAPNQVRAFTSLGV